MEVLPSALGSRMAPRNMLTVCKAVVCSRSCMEQVHCNHQQAAFCFSAWRMLSADSHVTLCIKLDNLLNAYYLLQSETQPKAPQSNPNDVSEILLPSDELACNERSSTKL
jgi:hypothetical protein